MEAIGVMFFMLILWFVVMLGLALFQLLPILFWTTIAASIILLVIKIGNSIDNKKLEGETKWK